MPFRTIEGRKAVLSPIDPCEEMQANYFDSYLPGLKDEVKPFKVDVKNWFSQTDTDTLLYQMTRGDRTAAPRWMQFHREIAILEGNATSREASEPVSLRFSVQDTVYGEQALYKNLLVNCAPKP